MYEKFRVVGFSQHTSSIEVREKLAFQESEVRAFIYKMKETLGVDDSMVLSTCNRTEFYYSDDKDRTQEIISLMKIFKGIDLNLDLSEYFTARVGKDAVKHLYEVSLGLDAKVLGDIQISNQVKRAYQASADEDAAGPFLHRIMHSIFYANKRVVQETAFRDGAASTSYAAISITHQFIQNFVSPKILVLGLGEIGKDIAENLQGTKANITLATRTHQKAIEMSEELGFGSIPYDEALQRVADFDVILCSLAVSTPAITSRSFPSDNIKQKLLFDFSVPRSIEPKVESIPGVILYNIDQIDQQTSSILHKRESAIPDVTAIMNEAIQDILSWAQDMEVSPTIKKLKQALDDIRKEEIARYMNKASEKEIKLLDNATKNIVQKVIKLPVLQLKAACKRGEAEDMVEVLQNLFNLEKEESKNPKS